MSVQLFRYRHSSARSFGARIITIFASLHTLLLLLSTIIYAQDFTALPGDKLGTIKDIKLSGNKKIENDAILIKMKSKPGEEARKSVIADDIRTIHSLGYFDDIRVDYESGTLHVQVKERPTIVKIEFEGNDQVSTDDLKEVIKLKEYSILDVNKVKEDIAALQKHYEDKGFYLARISYETKKTTNPDELELIYRVSDFDKVRIKKITFLNNKRFSDEKLKSMFRNTKEGNFFSWASGSGSFKESAFKQDLQLLTFFYLTEGYVKFRYENPIVTVSDDKKWLFISIYLDEGERFNIGETDFGGDLLFEKQDLHDSIQLKKGDVFNIQKRNDDITKLTEKYQDLGYAFVNVNPKMNIHDDSRTVDIKYEFEKGNLAYFGEINILGNSKTRDKVIRRELRIREGELYNGTRLRVSRERVERLGFFSPGEVVFNSIVRKDRKDIVDIEIQIKERSTGTITLGMGYGSIQKFFLTSQISEMNLFGRGQNLSLSAQYAADRKSRSLSLGFMEPYLLNSEWSAGFDLFFISFPIPGRYLEFKRGFNVKFGHPLDDDVNLYFTYKFEHLELEEVRYDLDPGLDVTSDHGNLSSVGLSLVRDKRNNRFETSAGNYQSVSSEFAGVGGNKDFAKVIAEARYYYSFTDDLVFRTKGEIGHVLQTNPDRRVPPSEKFFLGGPNSLKGYEPFSITPKSQAGTPLGGVAELLYIAEMEYTLIREARLKFVTFFDMGNAYPTFRDLITGMGYKEDVGFGFRWFSPIGPLRFEWGFPLRPEGTELPYTFAFFIGPPF